MKLIKYKLLTLFLLICINGLAQQINLNGIITIHNSGYNNNGNIQYFQNAQVSADFTSPTTSDSNGNFILTFVGIDRGTSVDVQVEKANWEVVNKRDLQDVVVGRRTPLKIFLAKRGVLAQAQAELYQVSIKALTQRHDKLIRELRQEGAASQQVMADLEQKLNTTINNRFEAEELLNKQLAATQKRLPQFAKELASTNLDFASEMYRTAYEFFKKGEIEKAIETLDEAVLDKQAAEAVESLDTLKAELQVLDSARVMEQSSLDRHIESILLKAKSHTDQNQYAMAIEEYKQALATLAEVKDTNQLRFARIYMDLSHIYQQTNNTNKELEYGLQHLEIVEQLPAPTDTDLTKLYQRISRLYIAKNNLEQGVFYQQKTLDKLKERNNAQQPDMVAQQLILADLLEQYGQELQQQEQYEQALTIYQRLYEWRPKDKTIKRTIKQLKKNLKNYNP